MIQWLARFINDFRSYIILSILVTASLLLITFNKSTQLVLIRQVSIGFFGIAKSLITPFEQVVTLKEDVEDLQNANSRLMSELNSLRASHEESIELKKILKFKEENKIDFLPAKVISKISSSNKNTFIIDVGRNSGVVVNSPVLADAGIVGIVNLVSDDVSTVQTLNNLELNISVQNSRSKARGIFKWNGKRFTITNISKSADIKEGDVFFTSQFSTIFPSDIPIASVTKIIYEGGESFFDIEADPTVDIYNIRNVLLPKNPSSLKKQNLNFFLKTE